MFDERLNMYTHTHTVSDPLHGAHLLGSPDYGFCYTDLRPGLAPTPGLLPDLSVLVFSLFSSSFNGEYAKKVYGDMKSMLLASFHRHLDSAWQKIWSFIWSSRVRCMCSSICSSPFPLTPIHEVPILCEKPLLAMPSRVAVFLKKDSFPIYQNFAIMFLITGNFSKSIFLIIFSYKGIRSLSLHFPDIIELVMQIKSPWLCVKVLEV